jgi:hypothetical protein
VVVLSVVLNAFEDIVAWNPTVDFASILRMESLDPILWPNVIDSKIGKNRIAKHHRLQG